jgi:hypothetical protein
VTPWRTFFRQGIERQGEIGMGVDVDEARSEDPSGSVDLSYRGFGPSHLDRRYPSVANGDINGSRRTPGAIHDSGAADQQVVHALSFSRMQAKGQINRPSREHSQAGTCGKAIAGVSITVLRQLACDAPNSFPVPAFAMARSSPQVLES